MFVIQDQPKAMQALRDCSVRNMTGKLRKTGIDRFRNYAAPILIGRWGGEEFVAVLSGITATALKRLAERCRALVETSWVAAGRDRVGVTVSLGGTMFEQRSDTVSNLIRRADRLPYRSKAKGRNRVTVV